MTPVCINCNIMKKKRIFGIFFIVISTCLIVQIYRRPGGQEPGDTRDYQDTYKHCKPRYKIGFLKTHKCASSSIQNILMRYAVMNNLNVVMPSQGNYLGKYTKYQRSMMMNTIWERANLTYDIFCLHTIWNQEEVESTLGPGAAYVTMLRDPVDQFESMWNYNRLSSYYKVDLDTFATANKTRLLAQRAYKTLGRNQMLWDFGMSRANEGNITAAEEMIKQIQRKFHLVLIAERFQESMILMKELLCWDYRDVVNLKLNARQEKAKTSLSNQTRQALEEYLAADYKLYNHFHRVFQQKLREFGSDRMQKELDILQYANSNMKENCALKETTNENLTGERRLWGIGVVGYQGNNNIQCRYLAMAEMSFLDYVRGIQTKRAESFLIKGTTKELSTSLKLPKLPPDGGAGNLPPGGGAGNLPPGRGAGNLPPGGGAGNLPPGGGAGNLLPGGGARNLPPSGGAGNLPPGGGHAGNLPQQTHKRIKGV